MKKIAFLLIALQFVCLFSFSKQKTIENPSLINEIIVSIPSFMDNIDKIFNKDIQVETNQEGDIALLFSQIDFIDYRKSTDQRISRLYLFQNLEQVFRKNYSCPVFLDSIGNYFLITKSEIEGNDLINSEIELMDNTGNLVGKLGKLRGRIYEKAIKNDSIALYFNDANNYGTDFTIFKINEIISFSRKTRNTKKWTIRFQTPPNGFLLIGGDDLEYIVAFGNSIWKASLIDPDKTFWKIDNIGENVNSLYHAGKNFLGVTTFQTISLIDLLTGKIVFQTKRKSNLKDTKNKNIVWNKISVNNNTVTLDSYQYLIANFNLNKIHLKQIKITLSKKPFKPKANTKIIKSNDKVIKISLTDKNKLRISIFSDLKPEIHIFRTSQIENIAISKNQVETSLN